MGRWKQSRPSPSPNSQEAPTTDVSLFPLTVTNFFSMRNTSSIACSYTWPKRDNLKPVLICTTLLYLRPETKFSIICMVCTYQVHCLQIAFLSVNIKQLAGLESDKYFQPTFPL